MTTPSRTEVAKIIDRLLTGVLTREDASLWAGPLHLQESSDPLIEEALDLLTLIDAWQMDAEGHWTGYLYDFEGSWDLSMGEGAAAEGGVLIKE